MSYMENRNIQLRLDTTNIDKSNITTEGFLICDAYVTRSGIFEYRTPQGEPFYEYRPEDEVFNPASMDSLKLKPITNKHPPELVNLDNVKKYMVGTTGENISRQKDFVHTKITIMDKDTIEEINARKLRGLNTELSCGYTCDLDYTPGMHKDARYDAIQRKIRYNHLSLVDEGRAGPNVKLNFDNNKQENKMKFKIKEIKALNLDSFDCEITEDVAPHFTKLSEKLDEASNKLVESQKKVDELQAISDQAKIEIENLKKDKAELSDINSDKVKKMYADKAIVDEMVKKCDIKEEIKSVKEGKIAVIKALNAEFNADGMSDDYINARFDAIVDLQKRAEKENNNSILGSFVINASKADVKKDPREAFIEKSKKLGKMKEDEDEDEEEEEEESKKAKKK